MNSRHSLKFKSTPKVGLRTSSRNINEGKASSAINEHENSFNPFSTGKIKRLDF